MRAKGIPIRRGHDEIRGRVQPAREAVSYGGPMPVRREGVRRGSGLPGNEGSPRPVQPAPGKFPDLAVIYVRANDLAFVDFEDFSDSRGCFAGPMPQVLDNCEAIVRDQVDKLISDSG